MNSIDNPITIILLAAGEAQRFGSAKQLALINGVPMVRHAALVALNSIAKHVIIVLGAHQEQVRNVLADLPVTLVYNPDWQEGMGSSIRVGMKNAVPQNPAGVMVCLADQPAITTDDLNRIISTYYMQQQTIACDHDGKPGAPALFDYTSYPQLLNTSGTVGAKALLSNNSNVLLLKMQSATQDVDTPNDLPSNDL